VTDGLQPNGAQPDEVELRPSDVHELMLVQQELLVASREYQRAQRACAARMAEVLRRRGCADPSGDWGLFPVEATGGMVLRRLMDGRKS